MAKLWDRIRPDTVELLETTVRSAFEKQAERMVILDLTDGAAFADYVVICQGRSDRQVQAIREAVQAAAKKVGEIPIGVEGEKLNHWVLMDYGTLVFNIFYEPVRDYYDLEGLWPDAKNIDSEDLIREASEIKKIPLPAFLQAADLAREKK